MSQHEPIRVLHFADVHIGMENYGKVESKTGISSRVMDFLRQMSQVIEYAEEHDADLAVFAGDAFKNSSPNPTYQREFARRIRRLADQCPVVLVVGNHDIPAMVQKASTLDIFHTLAVNNVIVGRRDEVHWVETKRGPVQVATVPFPVRQRLLARDDIRGMSLDEIDLNMRDVVNQVIRGLAEDIDPEVPAILTGHFTVQGATYGSERTVMLGRDTPVLKSALTHNAWDYVALGHIHAFQDLNPNEQPPVVYSGSLERIDFGEEHDPKGFCWAEVTRGHTDYEFVRINARPFVTIKADVRDEVDPTDAVLDEISNYDIRGAVVRVIVQATPENEPLLRDADIIGALGRAGYVAAIQRQVERPVRTRLGAEHVEGLTPLELLERYLMSKDADPDRIELLKDYAQALFEGETDNVTEIQQSLWD
ncbi:MAG: exonuclease SbcCD subunit D [Chloroflexi bacterium]|nr:exonuclease SbcCD subunit D [Chloroflexota bacterium]